MNLDITRMPACETHDACAPRRNGEIGASETILRVSSLSKRFGEMLAIDNINFTVPRGEILGILGPNGAGKSTLIAMLTGLLEPDGGTIKIFGENLDGRRESILARMNVVSPYASLPGQLTVWQNLSVYADIYGVERANRRIAELLDLFGISSLASKRFSKLSSGQTIRVELCKALLNRPDLLLLDEPTVYLDNEIAARARGLILQERMQRGMTVIVTSHNIAEIEHLCDRVLLLNRGRIAACGTTLAVTRAILGAERERSALDEVFAHLSRGPA